MTPWGPMLAEPRVGELESGLAIRALDEAMYVSADGFRKGTPAVRTDPRRRVPQARARFRSEVGGWGVCPGHFNQLCQTA
jgi:hypothetical protein